MHRDCVRLEKRCECAKLLRVGRNATNLISPILEMSRMSLTFYQQQSPCLVSGVPRPWVQAAMLSKGPHDILQNISLLSSRCL